MDKHLSALDETGATHYCTIQDKHCNELVKGVFSRMDMRAFIALTIPFIIVVYLAVLLFIQAPRRVLLASLLGGLLLGVINMLVDILAYNAHWWHYTLNGLILHVPLPFYISSVLIYGSVVYLLIWRFWNGRGRWFSYLLLFGLPVIGVLRDANGYSTWDSPLALPLVIVMWLVMFYGGFFVFWRLAPQRNVVSVA